MVLKKVEQTTKLEYTYAEFLHQNLRCKYQRPKSLQLRVAFVATQFTLYCLSEIRIKVDILSHYYKHL